MAELFRCGWALGPDGTLHGDWRIAVEHGRIVAAESWSPTSSPYVDWSRWVVVPGFVDCHDHLGIDLGDEEAQAREDPATVTIKAVANARALLAAGITTLRDVGEKDHLDVAWRRALAEGRMLGPTLLISGQFLTRTGGHGWYEGIQADGPAEIVKAVRMQVRAGADWIKAMITGGISTAGLDPTRAEYTEEEIRALVAEAHRHGRKVAVHAHGGEALDWALAAGVDTVEHGVYATDRQLLAMAQQGVYLVSTYEIIHQAAKSEAVPEHYRAKSQEAVRQYLDTLARARRYGVTVAAGGDGWHGDPQAEARALVAAGFTPKEALGALTTTGARLLGLEDRIGTLAPGKDADFVALAGDPTADVDALGRVQAVVKQGTVVFPRPTPA